MNQKKAGVILSYASDIILIATTLLYTPIMLRLLGQSEYGLYQLVNSVVSYLGLFSLGFTAAYVRYFSRVKAEGTEADLARLNGMFMTVFLILAGIAALCGGVMVSNIRGIFGAGLTDREYRIARVLMLLMVFNISISFPDSVFKCIISAHERFFFLRLLTVLQNLLNPFLALPLLLMGYGSIGMVAVTTGLAIAKLLTDMWYVFRRLHVRFLFEGFDFSLFKDIGTFTFFIFLNQIIDRINWSVDRFLLGRMIGTAAVAVYSLGGQVNTLYIQLSTTISNVFVPQVNRMVVQGNDNGSLSKLFTRVGRMQFMLLSMVLSGFVFIGRPFMIKWGGAQYAESYHVALWLIVPVTVPLIQNLGIEIQRAKNMHQARSIVYFCIAIANIFISIPLIKARGATGAAIGTAISLTAGNILFMNWYYARYIGLSVKSFWKSIASFIPALCFPLAVGALTARYVQPRWTDIVIFAFAYMIVFFSSMYLFSMNEEEKRIVKTSFGKLLARKPGERER